MKSAWFQFILLAMLAGASATAAINDIPTNGVQLTDSIVSDLKYGHVKTSYLLAFMAEADTRPWYDENALLAIELTNKNWRLVHACRSGRNPNSEGPWSEMQIMDAVCIGSKDYNQRPTQAEVAKFIEESWWKFSPTTGFRIVLGEIYTDRWKSALGYEPKYKFSKPAA